MQTFDEAHYVADMYRNNYYPDFLVDKVKAALAKVVDLLESGFPGEQAIQSAFDAAMREINDLQEEFYEHDSEIETVARESIGATVMTIIKCFGLALDHETAMRERDW